jgi:thiol-disulfide isomerase/thioredoxin
VATDFKLRDLGGHEVSLSSMRGKVIFLNLWATWCEPCRREMPSIETLYEKFGKDKSFVILAVSEDSDGSKAVAPYDWANPDIRDGLQELINSKTG